MLIVYCSASGATRRYAEMLAARTGSKAIPVAQADEAALRGANRVVFATHLRAGQPASFRFLTRFWPLLREKRCVLLVVGLSPSLAASGWDAFAARAMTGEQRRELRVFYLRGAYDPRAHGPMTRLLMRALAAAVSRQGDSSMARALREGADYVSEDALTALVDYLR